MHIFYEVAGTVMGFFNAFKGSRPAIDNNQILIVRGRSRNIIPLDQFESKIDEVIAELGGTEVTNIDQIGKILTRGNKHINKTNDALNPVDNSGLARMKKELESMGLVVAYKVIELPKCDAVIAIWEDKNEIPPLYVEVTVTGKEDVKFDTF